MSAGNAGSLEGRTLHDEASGIAVQSTPNIDFVGERMQQDNVLQKLTTHCPASTCLASAAGDGTEVTRHEAAL